MLKGGVTEMDIVTELWQAYKELQKEGFRSYELEWWDAESPPRSFTEFLQNPGTSACFSEDYDAEVYAWLHVLVRAAMKRTGLQKKVAYSIVWDYPSVECALVVLYDKENKRLYSSDDGIGFALNDFVDAPFTEDEIEDIVSGLAETIEAICTDRIKAYSAR